MKELKACVSYEDDLFERLQNRKFAAEYITAAFEDGQPTLLIALSDVARARGGIASVADQTGLHRTQLYKTLSEHGNPRLDSLIAILDSLGLQLAVEPRRVEADREETLSA